MTRVQSLLSPTFRGKSQLDVESFRSKWIQKVRQGSAGINSIVRGYHFPVDRTPTYDPIYGEVMGLGEGR